MQSFGLYKPHFAFANSTEYKDELTKVRTQQKECIKAGRAATGRDDWAVNGDKRKGAKMIHDMQKLLIRAFNCECDDVIDHVKFNNIEAAEKRIETSFSAISKTLTFIPPSWFKVSNFTSEENPFSSRKSTIPIIV